MSEPNNDIQREPTFTYSIDPKSIRVTYTQKSKAILAAEDAE